MAFDTKAYAEELMKAAGVSDDATRQALNNIFSNEAVSKRLGDDVLRQSDYSRNMDALKTEKQKWTDWYNGALTQFNQRGTDLETAQAQLQAYEAAYGRQPNNGQQHQVQDFTSFEKKLREDWAKEQGQRDAQMIGLLKTGMSIASAHAVEFKEPLDTEALEKLAVEKNMPLAQAYAEFVRPRREATAAESRKAELQRAREEAVRDYASTHHIPVDTKPAEHHVFFDRDDKKQVEHVPNTGRLTPSGERTLKQNFVDAWNSASGSETSG